MDIINGLALIVNPIPTGHGRNQPIYECHVTTAGRNRVKLAFLTPPPSPLKPTSFMDEPHATSTTRQKYHISI